MTNLECPHIWYSELSIIKSFPVSKILTDEDHRRYSQYTNTKAKETFFKTRSFLYIIKKIYQIEDLQLRYTPMGKPYFSNENNISSEIKISISHSQNHVAIALCKKSSIGVDIEYRQKNIDLNSGLIKLVLNSYEYREFENTNNKRDLFFQLWTLKEAILKVIGSGLSIDMRKVSSPFFLRGLNIATKFIPFGDYACSLAKIGAFKNYELIKYA